MSPEALIPTALVEVASGKSRVVKVSEKAVDALTRRVKSATNPAANLGRLAEEFLFSWMLVLPISSENFARRGKKFFEIVETVESLSGETRSADRPSRRATRVKRLQRGRPQIRLRAALRRDRWRGYHGYGERSLAGD